MNDFENTPQFWNGKIVEAYLDLWLTWHGYKIRQTTPKEERGDALGDRHMEKGERKFTVDYKSGLQTYKTGNVFLETVSVDTSGTKGWVYTSKANYILYACLFNHKVLVFTPAKLQSVIEDLKTKFPVRPTSKGQNKGYNSVGVCVPLQYAIDHLADKVIEL